MNYEEYVSKREKIADDRKVRSVIRAYFIKELGMAGEKPLDFSFRHKHRELINDKLEIIKAVKNGEITDYGKHVFSKLKTGYLKEELENISKNIGDRYGQDEARFMLSFAPGLSNNELISSGVNSTNLRRACKNKTISYISITSIRYGIYFVSRDYDVVFNPLVSDSQSLQEETVGSFQF